MKTYLRIAFVVFVAAVALIWLWSIQKADTVSEQPSTARTYHDTALGFSITLPTELSSTTSETLYRVDPAYVYTALGPEMSILGVRFTIPTEIASGTNLAIDTYLSVENRTSKGGCDALAFLGNASGASSSIHDGTATYSFASSSDAGAGNRYEEYVYALPGSNPCIAVRYFIHYAAIQNFPDGSVHEFDKAALMKEFDTIRRTLTLSQ